LVILPFEPLDGIQYSEYMNNSGLSRRFRPVEKDKRDAAKDREGAAVRLPHLTPKLTHFCELTHFNPYKMR